MSGRYTIRDGWIVDPNGTPICDLMNMAVVLKQLNDQAERIASLRAALASLRAAEIRNQ